MTHDLNIHKIAESLGRIIVHHFHHNAPTIRAIVVPISSIRLLLLVLGGGGRRRRRQAQSHCVLVVSHIMPFDFEQLLVDAQRRERMAYGANLPDIVDGTVGAWTGRPKLVRVAGEAVPCAEFADNAFVAEFTAFEVVFAHFAWRIVVGVVFVVVVVRSGGKKRWRLMAEEQLGGVGRRRVVVGFSRRQRMIGRCAAAAAAGRFDNWRQDLFSARIVWIFTHQEVALFAFLGALDLGAQRMVVGMQFALVLLAGTHLGGGREELENLVSNWFSFVFFSLGF